MNNSKDNFKSLSRTFRCSLNGGLSAKQLAGRLTTGNTPFFGMKRYLNPQGKRWEVYLGGAIALHLPDNGRSDWLQLPDNGRSDWLQLPECTAKEAAGFQ